MALVGKFDYQDFDNITITYDGSSPTRIIMYKANKIVKQVDLTYTGSEVTNILIDYRNGKIENIDLSYDSGNVNLVTKEVL